MPEGHSGTVPEGQPAPQSPKTDPYDLGNTELDMRQPDGLPVEPAKVVPPKDPVTGRFVSPNAEPASLAASADAAGSKPQHPSYLVRQAVDIGIPQEDIEAMETEALGRAVHFAYKQQLAFRDESSRQRDMQAAQVHTPERVAPKVEEDAEPDVTGYDPVVAAAIKRSWAQDKKIKELEDRLSKAGEREQARERSEQDRIIDTHFEKLGPAYESIFGKGTLTELPEDAPERERRLAVVQAAVRSKEGSFGARLAKAAKVLFGDGKVAEPKVEPKSEYLNGVQNGNTPKPRITPEQWNDAATAQPTNRNGATEPKGDALAIANLERKLREQGGDVASDSEIKDTLLK